MIEMNNITLILFGITLGMCFCDLVDAQEIQPTNSHRAFICQSKQRQNIYGAIYRPCENFEHKVAVMAVTNIQASYKRLFPRDPKLARRETALAIKSYRCGWVDLPEFSDNE